MTVAAAVVTTTAFVGPMNTTATARTAAVADDAAAGNTVKGGGNRDNLGRLRTREYFSALAQVPPGTASLSVTANCPSRTEVTGGGFTITDRSDVSSTPPNVVTGIRVLTSQRSGDGWTVTVTNPDPATPPATGAGTVRAFVECGAIVRDNNNW